VEIAQVQAAAIVRARAEATGQEADWRAGIAQAAGIGRARAVAIGQEADWQVGIARVQAAAIAQVAD